MGQEIENAINAIREQLPQLNPEQRVEVFESIMKGFCKECGRESPDWRGFHCQCWNDE